MPNAFFDERPSYREHAEEMDQPLEPHMFFKPLSALCGPDDPIVFPPQSRWVDYQGELAIVMKKRCHHVAPERARRYLGHVHTESKRLGRIVGGAP